MDGTETNSFCLHRKLGKKLFLFLQQIDIEFDLMFPTGSEFLKKWHVQFTPKIIEVAKSQKKTTLDDILSRFVDGDGKLLQFLCTE